MEVAEAISAEGGVEEGGGIGNASNDIPKIHSSSLSYPFDCPREAN